MGRESSMDDTMHDDVLNHRKVKTDIDKEKVAMYKLPNAYE